MSELKKINNYLQDVEWFAHAPGEQTQYGTCKGILIFFDKVKYDKDKIICKDTMGNGENSKYLSEYTKGIKHFGGGEYELDKNQFVPLKLISAPAQIKVGDYFYSTAFGCGGIQFKPIQSFSRNPWRPDEIDSFVCNSSYSFRGFCRTWRGGRVCMIKSDDKLKSLLSKSILIV